MGKKEIVERFLSDGYSLEAAALQFFVETPEKVETFLSIQKNIGKAGGHPAIIALDYVRKVMGTQPAMPTTCAVKMLKDFNHAPEKLSVEDAVSNKAKEYEEVRKVLSGKLDGLLSINKIQRQQKFSLIVGVLEKVGEGTAVVEDATGTATLRFGKADLDEILEGDIVGVACEFEEECPAVKKIFWPDIPLKRKVESSSRHTLCAFVYGNGQHAAGFEAKIFEKFAKWLGENINKDIHVIAFSKQEHLKDMDELLGGLPAEVCRTTVPTPSIADIAGLKIVSCESSSLENYKDVWGSEERIVTNVLKRRILPLGGVRKCGGIGSHGTLFDDIPDIFIVTGSKEPSTSNYKGTTLINIGSFSDAPTFFTVDMLSRDVNKLDLS
ncbi:MAG: hypothetical protein ABIA12_00530 [Candidatus Aenigmatarchaeota archaeon]